MALRKHMRDACQVGAFVAVLTGVEPVEDWTYATETRCRFERVATRETIDGDKHSLTGVQIVLPIGQSVTGSSRIKLTKRNGGAVTEYYDVVGDPHYTNDNRSIVCDCKSVEVA